jgi:hypothetical protein
MRIRRASRPWGLCGSIRPELQREVILDGEIVCPDAEGQPQFYGLLRRSGRHSPGVFYAFHYFSKRKPDNGYNHEWKRMSEQLARSPSDLAVAKLREKVMADTTLAEAVKNAFLADLATTNHATLPNLKAILEGDDQTRETGSSQSE